MEKKYLDTFTPATELDFVDTKKTYDSNLKDLMTEHFHSAQMVEGPSHLLYMVCFQCYSMVYYIISTLPYILYTPQKPPPPNILLLLV